MYTMLFKGNEGFFGVQEYPELNEKGKLTGLCIDSISKWIDSSKIVYKNKECKKNRDSEKCVTRKKYTTSDNKHYNEYFIRSDDMEFFDKKFKLPCHKLNLSCNNLIKIRKLPEELLRLSVTTEKPMDFPLELLPENIVSLSFITRSECYPFNGVDLSRFKKLKVFNCSHNKGVKELPIFPKSIEFLYFNDTELTKSALKKFNVSDYPKLRYVSMPRKLGKLQGEHDMLYINKYT